MFDVDREELGFLVVALGSVAGVVEREVERWSVKSEEGEGEGEKKRGMISRRDVEGVLPSGNGNGNGNPGAEAEDEETEMARLLDEKVGA